MLVLKKVVIAVTGLALFSASPSLHAQVKFPVVVAFGGSFSEAGNVALCTNPVSASGMHLGGTWVMQLAAMCGTTLTASKLGGTDFAKAGAGSAGLTNQLQAYLATTGGAASPTALYTVSMGGNDFMGAVVHGKDGLAAATNAADNDKAMIDKLANLGAKTVMWVKLPGQANAPVRVGKPDPTAAYDAFYKEYATNVAALRAAHPDLKLIVVDFAAFSKKTPEEFAAEGFTNTTQSWLAAPADVPYSRLSSNPDADKFVFFDGLHPTTHMHQLFAQEAYKDLQAP